jgi:DNA-binding GntR family transcriptional regulator
MSEEPKSIGNLNSTDFPPGRIAPIARVSAPVAAAQSIRAGILTGRLKPGDRLVEQEMARSLGIGQPTIREAMKELEYQGLVRKSPHRGTYVTQLSHEDHQKIAEVRNVLESMAVEKAALNLTPQAAAELREIVKEMDEAIARQDLPRFTEMDIAFHRKVWELAGNAYLTKALEAIVFQLFVFGALNKYSTERGAAAVRQHRAICEAICSGQPSEARRVFLEETLKVWESILQEPRIPRSL